MNEAMYFTFASLTSQHRPPATDSLGDIWKHIYLGPRNHGALWLLFFALYKYAYLLIDHVSELMTNYPQKGRDQSRITPFQFRDLIYIFARNKAKTDRLQKVLLVPITHRQSFHNHSICFSSVVTLFLQLTILYHSRHRLRIGDRSFLNS